MRPELDRPRDREPTRGASLGVHLLSGLPTESVSRGFELAGEAMPVFSLDSLVDVEIGAAARIGVVLPPFVEPSLVVESWEECDFLPHRFGCPAHIEAVWTFVDIDRVDHQLASSSALSTIGWGQSEEDGRSIADILVGQIESATRLALVGDTRVTESLTRALGALNPTAKRFEVGPSSDAAIRHIAAALCSAPARAARPLRSARVVPPWLEALNAERDPAATTSLFVYRRPRPFDAERFGAWMQSAPDELLRGKGRVWIESDAMRSYGYSCAGSVHRLFPGPRWWASLPNGTWPTCDAARRRLLARWDPRIGDRRQDLVFIGVDLDVDGLCAELDACLTADSAADRLRTETGHDDASSTDRATRLH